VLVQFEEQALSAKFHRLSWRRATSYTWTRLPDPVVRRQLHMLAIEGRAALPEEKFNEVSYADSQETSIAYVYSACGKKDALY
jgi:peptidyl-dipeptidase A